MALTLYCTLPRKEKQGLTNASRQAQRHKDKEVGGTIATSVKRGKTRRARSVRSVFSSKLG